jgi:hypothetical protein
MAATYNFEDHIRGNTFEGVKFNLNDSGGPIVLTGASIELRTSKRPINNLLSTGNGKIVITAVPGEFQVKEQIIDWVAGKYYYSIKIVFPDGTVKTYIKGTWRIINGYS